MATRKTTDDKGARDAAEAFIAPAVPGSNGENEDVIKLFDTAEFETAKSRVGGAEITLRRVVLTGPWEVAK